MRADTGIKANAVNDILCIQTFHFCIGIQLIKIRDAQCKIGIGKKLDCFRFRKAHEKGVDILFYGALLQKTGKGMGRLHQPFIGRIGGDDDAGGIQVVVQRPGFAQEFRAENNICGMVFFAYGFCIAHWYRALDYHDRCRIYA